MLEAFQLSDRGCVRANNEDYCLIAAELGLYVLADGMGGARAGEHASRLAVDTVVEMVRFAGRRDSLALLAAEEALRRHPMRHVLTMAIGAAAPLTINSYAVAPPPGSLVLICSDGLHGVV